MSLLTPNYSNTHLHQELPLITPSNRRRYCQRERLIINCVGVEAHTQHSNLEHFSEKMVWGCKKVKNCCEFAFSNGITEVCCSFTFTVEHIKVKVKGIPEFVVFMRLRWVHESFLLSWWAFSTVSHIIITLSWDEPCPYECHLLFVFYGQLSATVFMT